MHPILFTAGPITLYTYGAMMVAGFLLSTWLACEAARKLPPELVAITDEQLVDFVCLALLGGILGGRLFFVVLSLSYFVQHPAELLAVWHGGLVWYGGFLGGLLAAWLYVRRKRLDFLRVADQFVPFLALGHALGRVGCFFNGCCYGKPTEAWCGILFPGHEERLLPTQLFEAFGLCILFLVLRRLQTPKWLKRPGFIFGSYLVGYGMLRFVIEHFRGDQPPWWMGLTLQQGISLGLILAGTVVAARRCAPTGSK